MRSFSKRPGQDFDARLVCTSNSQLNSQGDRLTLQWQSHILRSLMRLSVFDRERC